MMKFDSNFRETTTGSQEVGNAYARVDTTSRCEDFSATQCQGTVFYNGKAPIFSHYKLKFSPMLLCLKTK